MVRHSGCWLIVGALSIAPIVFSEAKADIGGWPLLKWGMTRSEMLNAVPDASEVALTERLKDGTLAIIRNYTVGSCQLGVNFNFKRGVLSEVELKSPEEPYSCMKDIEGALLAKYGPPTKSYRSSIFYGYHTWSLSETSIEAAAIFAPHKHVSITVTYSPAAAYGRL